MLGFFRRIVLNDPPPGGPPPGGSARAPHDLGEELQRRALAALGAGATSGGRIDYARLRGSAEWGLAVDAARALQGAPLAELIGRAGRLAFWINVYNALALHAIVALGVRRSVHEVPLFFSRVSYRIDGFRLSLDDIEHGILRGNRRRLFPPFRAFGRLDPRGALSLDPVDPRIHFALNCGAQSCPPVGVYHARAIDQQLDLAARNFVNQAVTLDGAGRVACSQIFRWYRIDFEQAGGLVPFLLRYLDEGPVRAAIDRATAPRLRWAPYHWTLAHEPDE
ncbi:MAG TPA: DUF547 domain-containing protein [Methylomirabilota bacterium]|jgi:hypothetical protein|nr:DUF547 domain-containing protein [Methylomirabilota bacterium]